MAQSTSTATLSAPDTTHFPHLTALLDVHDPSGAFIHGLIPSDVSVLENDLTIPVTQLQEQKPGVQFVIAIAPGDTFTTRDGMGVSRFEYFLQALLAGSWVNQPAGTDDFSLLTDIGPLVTHSTDPASIRSALEAYKPERQTTTPSLEALSAALQLVSDPTSRPGMERAILFITQPLPGEVSLGLQSIITSANQQGIRIYPLLLASPDIFDLPATELLRNLAEQTLATFFAFSQTEPVPDLETLLEPLRYTYQLGYDSLVASAGPQQVSTRVMLGGETITTLPQTFDINLAAPSPVLLSLPTTIIRSFSSTPEPGMPGSTADLVPAEQVVQIQVAFPDGHERPLARTSLYIDNVLNAENTASPFDQFLWDLRPYVTGGTHTLRVEILDNLGFTGKTGETTITISVPTTTQGVMSILSQKRFLLVGVVVLISASILVLVLILGGRIQPKPHPGQVVSVAGSRDKTRPSSYRESMRLRKDPVTQPVKIAPTPPAQAVAGSKRWKERLPFLKKKPIPTPAIAYLLPLVNADESTLPAPLRVIADDVTLGRDPLQASLVVAHPSLEPLHARIHHEDGKFLITDGGSVAGTWVNYKQVPPSGILLEHADIIHLGAVGLRFNLAHPVETRKVVITPLEPGG